MVVRRSRLRDFCLHTEGVNGWLPPIEYEVDPTCKKLSIACWNFKKGICDVLWKSCPINRSPEAQVESNAALLSLPKPKNPSVESVESDVVSPEQFLLAQEAFLINPDKSGKILFDDQAEDRHTHLIIQARRLGLDLVTSDYASITSIRAEAKSMLDWMRGALLKHTMNISKLVNYYDKLDEETKSANKDEANNRLGQYLEAIEWIWRTMKERVPYLWIDETSIFDNYLLSVQRISNNYLPERITKDYRV